MPTRPHETVLAHVTSLRPVTEVRSSLLQASVTTLRARGHERAYLEHLDPKYHEAALATGGPPWLPIDAAIAHYAACDRLDVDAEELRILGWSVGDRLQGTFMNGVAQGAQAIGVTPWKLLGHFQRLWARVFQHGSIAVGKSGPKDGIVEVRGLPLARFLYFRTAFSGVIARAIEFGGGRAVHVSVVRFDAERGEITFAAAWV